MYCTSEEDIIKANSETDNELLKAGRSVCRIRAIRDGTILSYETAFVVKRDDDESDKAVYLITSDLLKDDVTNATRLKLFFADMSISLKRKDYVIKDIAVTSSNKCTLLRIFKAVEVLNLIAIILMRSEVSLPFLNQIFILHYGYVQDEWCKENIENLTTKKYTEAIIDKGDGAKGWIVFKFPGIDGSMGGLIVDDTCTPVGVVKSYKADEGKGIGIVLKSHIFTTFAQATRVSFLF